MREVEFTLRPQFRSPAFRCIHPFEERIINVLEYLDYSGVVGDGGFDAVSTKTIVASG